MSCKTPVSVNVEGRLSVQRVMMLANLLSQTQGWWGKGIS